MNIKEAIKAVVAELQDKQFGENAKTIPLDCADGTIRAYLSEMANLGERYASTPNNDGSYTISRHTRKHYKGDVDKSEIKDRLSKMKHGDMLTFHKDELAMSMKRASAIIVSASNTGEVTPMFIKGNIRDELFVVCLWRNPEDDRYEDEDEFEVAAAQMQQETAQPDAPATTVDDDPDVDWRNDGSADDDEELI